VPSCDASTRIARPVGEVFKVLSNVVVWPRWMPVESMALIDAGAARIGMRASGAVAEGSRHAPFSVEIIEFEPERRIAFRTLSGPISWEVQAIDAGTTEVRSVGTMRMRGIRRRVLEPLTGGEVRRNEAAELAKLRGLLEATTM